MCRDVVSVLNLFLYCLFFLFLFVLSLAGGRSLVFERALRKASRPVLVCRLGMALCVLINLSLWLFVLLCWPCAV